MASPNPAAILAEAKAASGGSERYTVGVGEEVKFEAVGGESGDWTATGGTPGTSSGPSLLWNAPGTAGQFTIKLKTDKGEVWAAVPETKLEKGAEATVVNAMPMQGFESKTLNKKFDLVYFGTLAGAAGAAPMGGAAAPGPMAGAMGGMEGGTPNVAAQHANVAKAPVEVGSVKVDKASGADARTVADLAEWPYPRNPLVPLTEVVHDRLAVEVFRGCTRGCRFCQAGMITRPVRERTVEEVLQAAEEAIKNTGFEDLALLSLSSSDYTNVLELVTRVGEKFGGKHLKIGLPSLRIESVSIDLMEKLKDSRSGGFTLAPEAATERMRRIINKFIPDEDILNTTREIYRRGWTTIKLYFMIGHPSETLEDVQAIADLCKRVLAEGRKVIGMKAKLNAGVSTFVPKSQTPFQWVSCDMPEQIRLKQALLRRELGRDRNIKLSLTKAEDSFLEAWLSRGDRRMADVVYSAWKNGSKFDAWDEGRNYEGWLTAFEQYGLDPLFYTHRQRRTDEVFPWEHITAAVRKNFLFQDFQQSLEGQIRVDCRLNCFACGILPTFANMRRENPGDVWKCPDVKSPARKAMAEPSSVNSLPMVGD